MTFLFGVDADGHRGVRWPRLNLAWAIIMAGSLLGSSATGYILAGEWSQFKWVAVWMGVLLSATVAVYGFATPKGKLPGS